MRYTIYNDNRIRRVTIYNDDRIRRVPDATHPRRLHSTERGACLAYSAIMERLRTDSAVDREVLMTPKLGKC